MKIGKKKTYALVLFVLGMSVLAAGMKLAALKFDRRLFTEDAPVLTTCDGPTGRSCLRVSAGAANAWLISCEGGYLMIDTGYPGDYGAFRRGLEKAGIDIREIRYLFITHAHDEHAGFAAILKEDSGCVLILPESSLPGLASGRFDWEGESVNPAVHLLGQLYNLIKRRDFSFAPLIPDARDIVLSGTGSELPREFGIEGEFLSTPGHTADSWSLLLDDGSAFVGDAAMNTLSFFGAGKRPIFMEERREVYASLELLKRRGARWILSGHGDPFPAEMLPRYREKSSAGPGAASLQPYMLRLFPGFLLILLLLYFGGRKSQGLRIFIYILGFILFRDLMTPFGFWTLGSDPVFWLRFAADGALLIILAFGSLGMSALVLFGEKRAGNAIVWLKGGAGKGICIGVLGALLVALPLVLSYQTILPGERGGRFPASLIPALLFLGLSGNLLEELLFRGYLQNWLEESGVPGLRAAVSSGLLFGLCHVFLAYTVTDVGWPLILFATWEGIICGIIGRRHGLVSAVLTHGLAVSLLAAM